MNAHRFALIGVDIQISRVVGLGRFSAAIGFVHFLFAGEINDNQEAPFGPGGSGRMLRNGICVLRRGLRRTSLLPGSTSSARERRPHVASL